MAVSVVGGCVGSNRVVLEAASEGAGSGNVVNRKPVETETFGRQFTSRVTVLIIERMTVRN